MNKRFGTLDAGNDKGLFKDISDHETLSTQAGLYPSLWTQLVKVLVTLKIPTPLDLIIEFVDKQIKEFETSVELGKAKDEADIEQQSMYLRGFAAHYADPDRFPHQALNTVGIMNVVAGSDTTSTGLAAIVHFLTIYPKTLEKVR